MAEPPKPAPPSTTTDPLAATVGTPRDTPPLPAPLGPGEGARSDGKAGAFDATLASQPEPGAPPGAVALELEAALSLDGEARYVGGALLGRGGMGEVRRFSDRRLGREVALKTLHAEHVTPEARRRFLREVWVQARLDHPSVVPVFDVGKDARGDVYFTMRRIEGPTLRDVLERLRAGDERAAATWTRRKLLTAFANVCLTVHYAHTRGVVHRDLKPDNVMLGAFGEVYVLDWGVAKLLDSPSVTAPRERLDITASGAMVGTPAYMAPEQIEGRLAGQDARTDVWALGCTLYEILAGRPLHPGRTVGEILLAVQAGSDPRASLVTPDVPPEIDAILVRALARDPAARFPTAGELAAAVERFLDGDRDLERRRELAAAETDAAQRALATANGPDGKARYVESRRVAMKHVSRALALAPEQPEARRLLVTLLTEEPPETPPAVERELARAEGEHARRGLRIGQLGLWFWVASIPLVVAMGVRDWRAIGPVMALVLVAAGFLGWTRRQLDPARYSAPIALLLGAMAAGFSSWLGPFVLTPLASFSAVIYYVLHGPRRWRWPVATVLALSAVAPFVAEWLHLVPPSHRFADGTVVLLPRGMTLAPLPTEAALVWISLSFVLLGTLVTARVRDALAAAEARNLLHQWRLRQLVPDDRTTGERDAVK